MVSKVITHIRRHLSFPPLATRWPSGLQSTAKTWVKHEHDIIHTANMTQGNPNSNNVLRVQDSSWRKITKVTNHIRPEKNSTILSPRQRARADPRSVFLSSHPTPSVCCHCSRSPTDGCLLTTPPDTQRPRDPGVMLNTCRRANTQHGVLRCYYTISVQVNYIVLLLHSRLIYEFIRSKRSKKSRKKRWKSQRDLQAS